MKKITENMNANGIRIWDEIYPCVCFAGDIGEKRLYVLEEKGELLSAFALCDFHAGAEAVKWENGQAGALYLERLGVNAEHLRKRRFAPFSRQKISRKTANTANSTDIRLPESPLLR